MQRPPLEVWQEEYLAVGEDEIFWFRLDRESGEVTDFGRNFRYKWAYDPREAVPQGLRPCDKPFELCPCCGLFGMAEKSGGKGKMLRSTPWPAGSRSARGAGLKAWSRTSVALMIIKS